MKRLLIIALLLTLTGATCGEIHTRKGTWYRVRSGDTLGAIAQRYRSTTQMIAEINNITDPKQLKAGQRIYIPRRNKKYAKRSSKGQKGTNDANPIRVEHGRFIWPVDGPVNSGYGIRNKRRHDGIDIKAARGTPIKAAGSGEVVFSGRLRGYGNLMLVKHKDDYFTAYAHNARNLKKKGTKVKQGEVIARVGSTGRSTGPHLHFEVRTGSVARNPLFFLPKRDKKLAKK